LESEELGETCPRCGSPSLKVFYPDHADGELGAVCKNPLGCTFKGFYVNGRLVELVEA